MLRESLGARYDLVHRLHDLHGVLPLGRLPAEHDAVGPIVYCVRDVGHLSPRRSGVLCHRLEHLRRDDHRLPGRVALRYHLLLRVRHLLDRDLHSQVPSCHHDPVAFFQYRVEVVQPRHTLDLAYDQGEGTPELPLAFRGQFLRALLHVRLDLAHALRVLDERRGHVVDVLRHPVLYVDTVLGAHGREVRLRSGEVHPRARADLARVVRDARHVPAFLIGLHLRHGEDDGAVVEQYLHARY
mmetsp:Transcript_24217/g.51904  ORF Transcript_24217/g.51904 Transcript_24217/m.51904 type:complete len:241 (-) Transcript_24217:738-1460(-)